MRNFGSILTSRRNFLVRAAVIAPTAALPVAAAPSADAELLHLHGELCAKWVAERAIPDDDHEAIDAAAADCSATVAKIENLPATTMEGLKVKAAAFLWCRSGELDFELSPHRTTDVRLAESILRDLIG